MRTRPRSWSHATCEKIGPQTGMVRVPWPAATASSPEMTRRTFARGNLPPFFAEIRVRSDGAVLRDIAIGPSPFALGPWQTAQYALYRLGPWTESISFVLSAPDSLSACLLCPQAMPQNKAML